MIKINVITTFRITIPSESSNIYVLYDRLMRSYGVTNAYEFLWCELALRSPMNVDIVCQVYPNGIV